jgi:hypothetical protein
MKMIFIFIFLGLSYHGLVAHDELLEPTSEQVRGLAVRLIDSSRETEG